MGDDVRDSYDEMAELYASLFLGDLQSNKDAVKWLSAFADLVRPGGTIADVGCGPGHVVNHLSELGLTAVGYDLSPGQIEQAHKAFPDLAFHVGDLTALEIADASLAGLVSRYSIIHLNPDRLREAFSEWLRVLESGGPVLVSFFGARSVEGHAEAFDHKVVTAYALFPATVAELLRDAGFTDVETGAIPIPEGGRPFDQGTVLARKPAN